MSGRYGSIVNSFLHDLSSGLWAAGLLVVWRLAYVTAQLAPPAARALAGVSHELFTVMLVSLAGILVTGGIRLGYWRRRVTADELPYRRRALLVKHALYLAAYGAGTLWAWALQR